MFRRRSSRRLAAVVPLLLLVIACGGQAAPPTAAPTSAGGGVGTPGTGVETDGTLGTPGAFCNLVTRDEIEAAAGDGKKVSLVEGGDNQCTWTLTEPGGIEGLGGSVVLRTEPLDPNFQAVKTLFPQGHAVSGLGDAAYYGGSGGLLGSILYVADGARNRNLVVQLVLFKPDEATNEALAVAVARKALERS